MLEKFYYMFFLTKFSRSSKSINYIAFKAYVSVSYFQILNVISFWLFVNHYHLFYVEEGKIVNYTVVFCVIIAIINYLFLYRKRREIIAQVEALPEKKKKREKILFLIYVFASVIVFALLVVNRN